MTPKKFRQIISRWRMERYSMKMDLPKPMTATEIDSFLKKIGLNFTKKMLQFTFEFGGVFKIPFAEIPDSLIPGNFSASHNMGEFYMLPWREILTEYQLLCKVLKGGDFDDLVAKNDREVQPVWYSPSWLPFAANGSGDFLCIDIDPTKSGDKGQVVCFMHESPRRPRFAKSVTEFFQLLANEYNNDRVYLTDEDYSLRKMRVLDFPTIQK